MRVAGMRDLIVISEADEDQEALAGLALSALDQALDDLSGMRAREGEALMRDMLGRLDALEALTDRIEERYPVALGEYAARCAAASRN